MRGPSGRALTCGIYSVAGPGAEERVGYGIEGLLRSQRTADLTTARDVAEEFRVAVVPKGVR